jgi:hypothetical protein
MNLSERRGGATLSYRGRPGPQGIPGPQGYSDGHLFREFSFSDLDNPIEIGVVPAGYIVSRCAVLIKTGFAGTSFTLGTNDDQDMLMTISEVAAGGIENNIIAFADKAVTSAIKIFPSFIVPPGFGTAEAIVYYSKEKV